MMNKQNGMARGCVKYGQVSGGCLIVNAPVGASEVFTDTGAKFVVQDGSGNVDAAATGATELFGHAQCGAFTSQGTDGLDSLPINIAKDAIYRMPADDTVTKDMVGKVCDLVVTDDVQYADVGTSTHDVLQIVDVDITNQEVLVIMTPKEFGQTGV